MSSDRFHFVPAMKQARQRLARACAVAAAGVTVGLALVPQAQAGRIVLNYDEWTLSNRGYEFAGADNTDAFVRNLAGFLAANGASGGRVLIQGTGTALTGSKLHGSLSGAGYEATIGTATSFDAAGLYDYDAVFVTADVFGGHGSAFAAYLAAGGGVYVAAAGSYASEAAGEHESWDKFLEDAGFALEASYALSGGAVPAGTNPLFDGVGKLYFGPQESAGEGQSGSPGAIRMSYEAKPGLISVYDSGPGFKDAPGAEASPAPEQSNGIPLPGTAVLVGLGLAGLAARRLFR